MARIQMDDGSWIDPDSGEVAGAAPGQLLSDYGLVTRNQAAQPQNFAPGATSWMDVLSQGIGHWSSYKIASVKPNPSPTALVTSGMPTAADQQRQDNGQLLRLGLIAAAVFFGVRALTAKG
jgi:hypothetical protein